MYVNARGKRLISSLDGFKGFYVSIIGFIKNITYCFYDALRDCVLLAEWASLRLVGVDIDILEPLLDPVGTSKLVDKLRHRSFLAAYYDFGP
ncbi:hypothetical protein D3C76_1286690 [compost metagenome]